MTKSIRKLAMKWARSGVSVVPVKNDGTKGPAVREWKIWQERTPTDLEIQEHFKPGLGIGVIGGKVSGNLEILDFDVPEEPSQHAGHCFFDDFVDQLPVELLEVVQTMPTVRTPGGGVHLYYRCENLEGNRKLAAILMPPGSQPSKKTVIETRGEGGYVLAPGCPPECHPTGNTYELISGSFESVPVISKEYRDRIFANARSFDETDLDGKESRRRDRKEHKLKSYGSNRPGDDFNRRGSWEDLLLPLGWTLAFTRRDGAQMWVRPGKSKRDGVSATVRELEGVELFHAFTSNSEPFPQDESITKFTAYALIHHNGDYESAARALGKEGYGEQRSPWLEIESQRGEEIPWCDEYGGYTKVLDSELSIKGEPDDIPFDKNKKPPPEASIFNEAVDPLEAQAIFDEEELVEKERERKRSDELELRESLAARGPGMLVWRDSGDPPKRKHIKIRGVKLIKTKREKPRDTAWFVINDLFSSKNKVRKLHHQNGEFVVWNKGKYVRKSDSIIRSKVSSKLTYFAEFDKKDPETEKPKYKEFEVRSTRVKEMMDTIKDMASIDDELSDPCWICQPEDGGELPDPREVVCCKNGLLDIKNNKLLPPDPSFYCFTNTGIEYQKDAPKPEAWMRFLDTTLEDEDSRLLLQEWFGYCLVQDTRKQKMLMVVGKPGSGKGTAITVLQWLIGKGSYCSMDFEKIGGQFALQMALGKSLMIFPDARQSYGHTKGNAIGTLLSISGEDDIFIERKHVPPITQKLNTRIVIVSNEVINLTDPSGALNRRMLWVRFPGFEGKVDTDLKRKLKLELSGILNWAIEGYHRVMRSGSFTEPRSADYLRDSFQEQASPIKSFIEDLCELDTEENVKKSEIHKYWCAWRKVKGYKTEGERWFGKQLFSADMRIKTYRGSDKGRPRYYSGINISKEKLESFIQDIGISSWRKVSEEFGLGKIREAEILSISEYLVDKEKDKKDKE